MINPFWDVRYEGKRIVSRRPKRERDVLPTIRGLLYDIATAKNFEVSSEYSIASGNLDFLIRGALRSGKTADVCVEFKNAHSTDLNHGLIKQLPDYMRAKACNYGVYCVLFYKGKYFDKPKENDFETLEVNLNALKIKAGRKYSG